MTYAALRCTRRSTSLVLERDRQPHAIVLDLAVLDSHVLSHDLGDPQVSHRFRRGLDSGTRGGLPGLAADPDHLGHPVNTVSHHDLLYSILRVTTLAHCESPSGGGSAPPPLLARDAVARSVGGQ